MANDSGVRLGQIVFQLKTSNCLLLQLHVLLMLRMVGPVHDLVKCLFRLQDWHRFRIRFRFFLFSFGIHFLHSVVDFLVVVFKFLKLVMRHNLID